jgi:HK97 family phage major capsid protein
MKNLGVNSPDSKFNDTKSDKAFKALEGKEKVAKFISAVYHKDIATLGKFKALSEGTDADGGFQVPEEFAAEVNRIVEDFGLVRKLSRKIPMNSDKMNVPRLASSVSVTFPGENVAGTESQPVWENVQLLANTAVGLTVSSNELLADANVSIVDLLAELFGEALAGEEDNQGFAGTGAPFTGILTATGVTAVTQGAGLTPATSTGDDYRDMISAVKPWSLVGAAFFLHRTVWGHVQKIQDTNGAYIASALNPIMNPVAGTPQSQSFNNLVVGTLWGYPVYLSDKLPDITTGTGTAYAIFGNLAHLYFGDRASMSLAISDSATVGVNNTFEQNQSAVRVTERYALAVGLPAAFARLVTN